MKISKICTVAACFFLALCLWDSGRTEEIKKGEIEDFWDKYQNISPPPTEHVPTVLETEEPLLESPTGALLVRTMPSSFNAFTGDVLPYAWPGRNFPIWGNVSGGTPPYTYEWDFGDASPPVVGPVSNANYIFTYHAYSLIGVYYAQLTVTDALAETASATVRIDVAFDAQQVRVNAAIEDGLRYLYLHQSTDGRWSSGYPEAATGAAVAEFCIRGHLPSNDWAEDIYADRVQLGLDWLFAHMSTFPIYSHGYCGNPDSNGNGVGIRVNSCNTYCDGIVMFALATSRNPGRITTTGPPGVVDSTYRAVLVDMVDQLAFSQTESGNARGGWRYSVCTPNYGSSDNSIVQWCSIALEAAEAPPWNISASNCVKDELARWLAYSQCTDGGFAYRYCPGVTVARTGSGIYSHYYLDVDRNTLEAPVNNALNNLCINWFNTSSSTGQFRGNFYAMYAVKKALEDYGIDLVCSGGSARSWKDDYEKHLVKNFSSPSGYNSYHQITDTGNPTEDGRWANNTYWVDAGGIYLTTSFALLILTPGVRPCTPVAQMIIEPEQACPGVEICFDGTDSYLTGAGCDTVEIVSWEWDLDADGIYERTGPEVCKPEGYDLPPGESQHDYTVFLRVTTNEGQTGVTSGIVHIGTENHPPVAKPGGPYTGCVGDTIYLDACLSFDPDGQCLGDSIVEYCWDFEPDGVVDLCTPDCIPDTFLIYYEEVYKYIQLRVKDTYCTWSDQAAGLVEVWSSYRELWVHETDITFTPDTDCETVEICATVHAGTQQPDLTIDSTLVDIYIDSIEPVNRLARFWTPIMHDGDAVT
ncbi:MAG: hypothetical protein JSV33_08930, partial [bacterium]